MPVPYSDDLRLRAIAAVKNGHKKSQVARFLKISRNTLDLWLKKEEESGNCHPVQPRQKGPEPKIKDKNKFRELVLKHNDKTQKQIAELWGEGVTQQNVSDACQKWGITRKKNLRISGKR